MSRDDDKLIRQLSLLAFLLSRRRPSTAREIQESVEGYFEMSDDTFARRFHGDRTDLGRIGIEIRCLGAADAAEAAEAQLYVLSEEDYRLPQVDITPAESRALALALAALDGRFAYARPLRIALMAISHGRHDPGREEMEQLPVALAPDEDARRAGKQLARLEDAVTRGKTVCFSYPSAGGNLDERTLDPYSLFLIQGHWYVVGNDHVRRAIRTFRIGRIKGTVRFLTEKTRDFSVPPDYDPDEYGARPPWLLGPTSGTATVGVGEDIAWWVRRLEPHVTWLGEDDSGCSRFTVPYCDEQVFLSWVVGLSGCGRLLEPSALRRRLVEALREVRRAHEKEQPPAATVPCGLGADRGPEDRASRPDTAAACLGPADPIPPEHLARAIALLHYLVGKERPALITWEALKRDVGLTRGEVETDLSLINLVNFGGGTYALSAEAEETGVRVVRDVMADAFSQPARLSPLMARALLLALDVLGDAFALPGLESLASVRNKVRALIGSEHSLPSVIIDELLPPDHEVVEVLNRAIRDRSVVELEYFAPSREVLTARSVEPYLLFHSPDGWYLEAYCLTAEGQRTFKLERMRSARSTRTRFAPRPEVDLAPRRWGQAFSPAGTAAWATVRFHPRWRCHLEDRGIAFAPGPGDFLEARVPYLDERWLALEIIRYLGEAVLVHPAAGRRRVSEQASRLEARYERARAEASSPALEEGGR